MYLYYCPNCRLGFNNIDDTLKHSESNTCNVTLHNNYCTLCHVQFNDFSELIFHNQLIHKSSITTVKEVVHG